MKRFYLGVGVLLVLLALGLGIAAGFSGIFDPMEALLWEAAGLEGAAAREKAAQAAALWQRWRNVTAAVADHGPVEDMDALFARLAVAEEEEVPGLAAELATRAEAMGQSQKLCWWSVL